MGERERSFDLAAYLEARRALVEERLARRAKGWEERVPSRLAEAMSYSLLGGGKRLRPLLCMAAFEGCGGAAAPLADDFTDAASSSGAGGGGTATSVAEDFADALELVHTYSLIHDDLPAMDDDDFRRGRPTCHKVYGEATAILAGDALLTEAFGIVAAGEEPSRGRLAGVLAAGAGASGMVGGQQLDIEMEGRLAEAGPAPDLAAIEEIHRRKTGALLTAAAEGGAIAAGASPELVEALRRYGASLGLAFQIADDILDVVGDSSAMGKSAGGDQRRGKPTYPALVGVEGARALGRDACDRAILAIEPLGEEGRALRALARYVMERAS